ncbi:glutathione reductase (NADPH) [Faunimonas pinastri]|uniref:Glutathione reductase (NADPH) n=1 Tax=Faunimonas pinastri TaxID=1855383 RepID=A0A1H9GRQ6_9HYPH|nr:NAD(P)/FAD-dependent oxidoreductase [Faunimonas pinastri]SEQ52713.1 glutathione reductase (NADPH) [Faunimonas pinastri]
MTFDLVVLGSGSAATRIAETCRKAGWSVAVVEEREFGGTCALRGCEPKKVIWTITEAVDRARRLGEHGVADGKDARVDWPALMAFKRSFTDPVPANRAEELRKAGIEAVQGTARFVGPNTIAVGDRELDARHIVIATGATPVRLPVKGFEHLLTSDDFLAFGELPRRIVLVGGGYISFEFAHMAVRAGAEVTLLHKNQKPLGHFDGDLVKRLVEHSRRLGIRVELDAEVSEIEKRGDGFRVSVKDGRAFDADVAIHGLGRVPNLDSLDLEAGDVACEKGRLKLDRHLRSTSNPAVFAAGDAASNGAALTPIATEDAECVAQNLLQDCTHEPDYNGFASVVFTIPPLAMTGLTEEKARENGREIDVHTGSMDSFQSVRRDGHEDAGTAYKVIVDRQTGCIVGAHLFVPDAQEVINLFALSVRLDVKASELDKLLSAYPSGASNITSMLG